MSNYLHHKSSSFFTIINLADEKHHQDHHHHHHHHQDVVSSSSSSSSAASITSSKDCHHNQQHLNGHHDVDDNNNNNNNHQSIDSLHGLRFLSMIWIIVIHSYNFALRWSFFSNTSSLDDLYKNSASQLIANGTFACDSFLFIGGFLLLYLAFPEQQQATHQSASSSSSSSSSSSTSESEESVLESDKSLSSPISSRSQLQSPSQSQSSSCCRLAIENEKDTLFMMEENKFTIKKVFSNLLHRYIRMMPLMMAIIALSSTLLRYLGTGQQWDDSTIMFDKWCRDNWWINLFFLHNFINRENMCLSHSWYSAVDIQLFFFGQLILFTLFRSKKVGLFLIFMFLFIAQLITGILTIIHNLPAVPLISSVSEQSENLYYGEIYIKPYCRASPYLIGILLAYLMRTTSLGQVRLSKVSF